ncbi:hypothetical protein [Streptomonospora litoralis]|uniref:Uncharacterized protein n=1 Tax=Streptomonospora litoralis TaxID=2498135 RepID=A0A4P6Q4X1_9ACTN|nr:hypothetical protein [Streptomonospora litoralis]QBI55320.1 hypothetical protein EKD16_17760 [Streptomonospora litoralis]
MRFRSHDGLDHLVARLRPQVNASEELDAARPAARELLAGIPEQEQEPAVAPKRTARRLLIAVPAAAVLAAGGVAATALMPTSAPDAVAPDRAAALEIDVSDGVVVAEVKDPTADPERYAARFAEHGLDVELSLVPASPTMVGKLVYLDGDSKSQGRDGRDVEVVEAPGKCAPGGGCPVGVRIPEGYENHVELAFGRKPQEGEKYQTTNSATAEGEALEGTDIPGMTVGEAEEVIAEHGQEVAEYRILTEEAAGPGASAPAPVPSASPGGQSAAPPQESEQTVVQSEKAEDAPDDYYVRDVSLWAPGEVLLMVSETRK